MADSHLMGLFTRKAEAPSFASAPIKAAAGAANVGNFLYYQTGSDEIKALSVPTVSRADRSSVGYRR